MTIALVCLIAALILFILAATNVGGSINLTALGLACWVLSLLVGKL